MKKPRIKSAQTIKKHLRELRQAIDESDDTTFKRVAYAIETAVRWATEPVVDWPGLLEQAREETEFLKRGQ